MSFFLKFEKVFVNHNQNKMQQVLFSSLISNYLIPYLSVEDLCNLIIVSKQFYKVYINKSKNVGL